MKRLTQACNYRQSGEHRPQHFGHMMCLRATRELLLRQNKFVTIDEEEYGVLTVVYEKSYYGRFSMKVKDGRRLRQVCYEVSSDDFQYVPDATGNYNPLHAAACSREIRAHIFGPLYDNLDIRSAHPVYFVHLFQQHDLPVCKCLPIVNNIREVRESIQVRCSVPRDIAKEILVQLPNGYSLMNWCSSHGVSEDTVAELGLVDYQQQVLDNRDRLLSVEPYHGVLLEATKQVSSKKNTAGKDPKRTAFSYICFDGERRMATAAIMYLEGCGAEVSAIIHDGMLQRKGKVTAEILEGCNRHIEACTGVPAQLVNNPLEPFEPLEGLPDDRLISIEVLFPEKFEPVQEPVQEHVIELPAVVPSVDHTSRFHEWILAKTPAPSQVLELYKSVTGSLQGFASDGGKGVYKIDPVSGRYIRYTADHLWVRDIARHVSSVVLPLFNTFYNAVIDTPTPDYEKTPRVWKERLAGLRQDLQNVSGLMGRVAKEFRTEVTDSKMIKFDGLDTRGNLIGFENGVLDLDQRDETGSFVFRKARPEEYVSLSTGYDYEPMDVLSPKYQRVSDIIANLWVQRDTLNENSRGQYGDLLSEDQDPEGYDTMRKALMLLFGGLYGGNKAQILVLLAGIGSNGKSVLVNLMIAALGEYYCVLPSAYWESFKKSGTAADPVTMALRGARFAFSTEIRSDVVLDAQTVKSITGGDEQTARWLFDNNVQKFNVDATPVWCVNLIPEKWSETGQAVMRRIKAIPFDFTFCASTIGEVDAANAKLQDSELESRAFKRAVGLPMMHLMLKYYKEYVDQNPFQKWPMSAKMLKMTAATKDTIDSRAAFVRETIARSDDPGFYVPVVFFKYLFNAGGQFPSRAEEKAFETSLKQQVCEILSDASATSQTVKCAYKVDGCSGTSQRCWARVRLTNPEHYFELLRHLETGTAFRKKLVAAYDAFDRRNNSTIYDFVKHTERLQQQREQLDQQYEQQQQQHAAADADAEEDYY